MTFSTSTLISSLICDKKPALGLSNFYLITLITSNSLVSIGVTLRGLASGILKQCIITELKETTKI